MNDNKKIKTLQVVSCLEKGGTEAYILNNFQHMDRERFSFDFLVFVEKEYSYYTKIINQLGGQIFFCGVPAVKRMPTFLHAIIEIIKQHGPYQVVHSHVNIANGWVLYAAKLAGVPVRISHSHATSGKDTKNFVRKGYIRLEELLIKRSATHFLACSTQAGEYLYGKSFFASKGMVSHNGIDISQFINTNKDRCEILRKELGLVDHIVFGNITRFESNKNTLFTVEVFSRIVKKCPNAVLLLGGPDGGLLEETEHLVQKLGLVDKVRFIGVRDDVPLLLQVIDLYLFPSLSEGLGLAVLEAQAAGVYTLASDTISKEADMGLGLMDFCPLDIELWADMACNRLIKKQINKDVMAEKFQKNGYLIEETAREIAVLYERGNTDV